MKKIGILTFHNANNYGAVLQAYALQTAIQILQPSCIVEILDYRNSRINQTRKVFQVIGKLSVKNCVAAILNLPGRVKKKKGIDDFISKYLVLSEKIDKNSIGKIKGDYDKMIVGSDQVWNYNLTNKDLEYFLPGEYREKNAYGVSIGNDTDFCEEKINELKHFKNISVREQSTKQILNTVNGIQSKLVCDPTMLLDKSEWDKIIPRIDLRKKYILVYSINPNIKLMSRAYEIAQKTGFEIRYISMNISDYYKIKNVVFAYNPTPMEFLLLIKNSEYVLTNSFHGTVFSILFNKEFEVEVDYGTYKNNRIQELLQNVDLENRVIKESKGFSQSDIEWEKVKLKVKDMQLKSIDFLEGILR